MSARIDDAAARLLGVSRASGTEKGLAKDIRIMLDALTVAQGKTVLSQPTPAAEPETRQQRAQEVIDRNERDRQRSAPPRIEHMALGATFTAPLRDGGGPERRWMVTTRGLASSDGAAGVHPKWIDPSTIRDVTPPEVTS